MSSMSAGQRLELPECRNDQLRFSGAELDGDAIRRGLSHVSEGKPGAARRARTAAGSGRPDSGMIERRSGPSPIRALLAM
jgi:hypothetical protein